MLFLAAPILHEAWLALFEMFRTKISMVSSHTIGLNLSLKFTNSTVSSLRSTFLLTPQILPLRATDLFALQELILCHFPIQRVWIIIHFLLELLDVSREYRLCRRGFLTRLSCVRTQLQVSPRSGLSRIKMDVLRT